MRALNFIPHFITATSSNFPSFIFRLSRMSSAHIFSLCCFFCVLLLACRGWIHSLEGMNVRSWIHRPYVRSLHFQIAMRKWIFGSLKGFLLLLWRLCWASLEFPNFFFLWFNSLSRVATEEKQVLASIHQHISPHTTQQAKHSTAVECVCSATLGRNFSFWTRFSVLLVLIFTAAAAACLFPHFFPPFLLLLLQPLSSVT